jgi:hypothetical protein
LREFFNIASTLDAHFINEAGKSRGILGSAFDDINRMADFELLGDAVLGNSSWLLTGEIPPRIPLRLAELRHYAPVMRLVDHQAQPKWSPLGRNAFFEIMMYAWVTEQLGGPAEDIPDIPSQLAAFEISEVRLISYVLGSLEKGMSTTMSSDAKRALKHCKSVVMRGLVDDVVAAEFEEAREAFELLLPFPDLLWGNDSQSTALRGYLAGLGLCLSWLEIRNEPRRAIRRG